MPKRTWVIPTGNSVHHNGGRGAWARPRLSRSRVSSTRERSIPSPTQRRSDLPTALHPGRTLALAYFLGPLGPSASLAGRSNRFWLLTGVSATALGLLTFFFGHDMAYQLERGSGYGVLWLTLWGWSWIGTCLAWSRGITMAGIEVGGGIGRLPKRLGTPWIIGFLGAIFPGLGLLLSGYPRRAGWALLSLGATVLGTLVLVNGRSLWKWNHVSHYGGFPTTTLEMIYLASVALGLCGILGWLIQALDGIRLAERKTISGSDHGDVFAIALVTALAVFAMVFRPAAFAAEFDHRAEWAQSKGLQITPLALATLAMNLDPSRPDYAIRVAELQDAMGHQRAAREIRAELYSDWAMYRAFAEPVTKKTRPASTDSSSVIALPAPGSSTAVLPAPALATVSGTSAKLVGPEPAPSAEPVVKPGSPVKITAAAPPAPAKTTTTAIKPAPKKVTVHRSSPTVKPAPTGNTP